MARSARRSTGHAWEFACWFGISRLGAVRLGASLAATALAFPAVAPRTVGEITIPASIRAQAQIVCGERDGLWEKPLVATFPEKRRTLGTYDGLISAKAAINHSAHPELWKKVSTTFGNRDGLGGRAYTNFIREKVARQLHVNRREINAMATAADMDNLAVVTREYGPLTVTVLATAGARSNAIRTGIDVGTYIEGEKKTPPHGTINIMLLTNARLTDGAMARAIVTVTEGKTAALEDLKVPSTYTPSVQATGTGTDSVIVVSGTTGPRASSAGGHSRIGKATYAAVVEALGKQNGFYLPGAKRFAGKPSAVEKPKEALRIALLHLAPLPGDIAGNRAAIEAGIQEAVGNGADWVVTPELAETGYNFTKRIGTDWIAPFPDAWIHRLATIARDNRVALFVGFAERDAQSGQLHNSVAVIDRGGNILGSYRKRLVHGRAEAWSTPGTAHSPFVVDGIPVGVLICADAYKPEFAAAYRQQGASILLSPANWPPAGELGPKNTWEKRSQETGLPLIVNNRTGMEPEIDFTSSESAVSVGGRRVSSFGSHAPRVFYVDWDGKREFYPVSIKRP